MKPKIKKEEKWTLKYMYPPRMFWMFGLNREERIELKLRRVREEKFDSWEEAINYLNQLFKCEQIVQNIL